MSIKKIVVIGPESTGKSTLSSALATALHTVWVPEYARGYLEGLGRQYNEEDLLIMARGQLHKEDEMMQLASGWLICDTDLNVIKVWSENTYGRCHTDILEAIAGRKYDLYLLTGIDMPWEDDPLREHSTPVQRNYFYNIYKDTVVNSGVPFVLVNGDQNERLKVALDAVSKLY